MISIQVQIDDDIAKMVDQKCGGPSFGGKRGGRADYLRQLIYRDVGVAADKGWLGRGPSEDISDLNVRIIAQEDPTCAQVIRLIRMGLSYRDIARHMKFEKVPTSRGGQWTYQTVRRLVKKAIRIHHG